MSYLSILSVLSYLSLALAFPLPLQSRQLTIPQYVLDYAPILWLYSGEQYMPSDIATQLLHTTPETAFTPITPIPNPLTLSNLNALNTPNGANVYLTSNEGIQSLPPWFNGVTPDASGKTNNATSCAIITVSKPNNILDAFYFYFYAYNQGDTVFGIEFDDHVGDWEHTMVRFDTTTSLPTSMWYSIHQDGEAFTYSAVEKWTDGKRPVGYVAQGGHPTYATSGTHDHTIPGVDLPFGLVLVDHTDKGHMWDPTLNSYQYSFDLGSGQYTSYNDAPVEWLSFLGRWGDQQLPDRAPGQIDIFGEAKYASGPTGPGDKGLGRTAVCPNAKGCIVRPVVLPGN